MIKNVSQTHDLKNNTTEWTIRYDENSISDMTLIKKIKDLINNEQRCCLVCKNRYSENAGNYIATMCKVHGCLELPENPYHDLDGSSCKDFIKE